MDPLEWPFKNFFISRIEIWNFSPICNLVYQTSCTTSFFYLWQMNDFRKKATLIYCHKCTKQLKISISKDIADFNVAIIRCNAKTISLWPRDTFNKYLILLSFGNFSAPPHLLHYFSFNYKTFHFSRYHSFFFNFIISYFFSKNVIFF